MRISSTGSPILLRRRRCRDYTFLSTTRFWESLLRGKSEGLALSMRQLFGSLRVAVTGRTATPPLFETMEVLGRERVLSRLQAAIERLSPA